MLTFLAIVLLVFAFCGLVALRYTELANFSIPYWFFGWCGHSFALPFAVTAALLLYFIGIQESEQPLARDLTAISLIGFIILHFRNRKSGKGMIKQIAEQLKEEPKLNRLPILAGLAPMIRRSGAVNIQKDISYGAASDRNRLDIYTPKVPTPEKMPILIDIHGGAWVTGNKSQQAIPLIYRMVNSGWMCVSITYRLGPKDRFPSMLTDVLQAIAWVKEHAEEYGGDPNFIALSGGSAGGHLTSLAALNPNNPKLQPGFEDKDTHVQVAVPLYGRYDILNRHDLWGKKPNGITKFMAEQVMSAPPADDNELWELGSPISQGIANAPPFLIIHGTHDSLIPVEEADHFVRAMRAVSEQPVIYCRLNGAQHAFDVVNSALTVAHTLAVAHFLNNQHDQYKINNKPV